MSRIYLDHAATTPMVPEAVEAMTRELTRVGNASSLHASGRIGAAGGRGVAGGDSRSGGCASHRVDLHKRRYRVRQSGRQRCLLVGRWGGSPAGDHLDDRTPRGAGFCRLARSFGDSAEVSYVPVDAAGRLDLADSRQRCRRGHESGLGDVGQQRGRDPAGDTRDRSRSPPTMARSATATRSKPSVTSRSTLRQVGSIC